MNTEQLRSDFERVKAYIIAHIPDMLKEPRGVIRFPFIDPGSVYDGNVWDWDTCWTTYGLLSLMPEIPPALHAKIHTHAMGNVQNFFDHQLEDGYIPMMIENDGNGEDTYLNRKHREGVRFNMHKPFLATQACLVSRMMGSTAWARPYAEAFQRYLKYYDTYFQENSGLYVWHDDIMIGMDNDPASFGRPHDSTANIFLNAFMVKELDDLASLYLSWDLPDAAEDCRKKRENLIQAIQRECWDERDGFFYSVDVDVRTRPFDWFHQGMGVFWKSLPIKIQAWSGFIPLYAGIASAQQAERMRRHAVNERSFCAPYGIYTLARDEKMFNLSATNNPSNWLGPIWLISNYVVCRGLMNYHFQKEAQEIAARSLRLLAEDLEQTGCLHEYYDPASGKPVMNGGFINWNILALTMAKETNCL